MNSRQRVRAAMRRQPVDRIPVFMWFHPQTAERLSSLLEVPPRFVGEAMGNDVTQTWVNNNYAMEGIVHEKDGESHLDYWGIEWVRHYSFNQIATFPLIGASPEAVLAYVFPYDRLAELLGRMAPLQLERGDSFLGCDVSPCVFEMYWRLRGMEDAMIDLAAQPGLAYTMLGRCADFSVALSEAACSKFDLDWLWTGDDVASQQQLMMSPSAWRELVKPHLKRIFDVGKSYGLPVAFHCCGALRPIIGDLVEIGMDVLNPVQSNCAGMDPAELKGEFGSSLTFMGGLDTQELLPFGSPAEVRRAVSSLVETMTCDGGGYILAASHTIPPETPDENIFALYDEVGIAREEIFDRASAIRAREG